MKRSIFTFFIFLLLLTIISSCATTKKRGCGCPGMSKLEQSNINQYI